MCPPGEMFQPTPLSEDHLLKQSEIMALRAITDAMNAMRGTLERMVEKVDDVQGRVIRLEERNQQVERLREDLTEAKTWQARQNAEMKTEMASVETGAKAERIALESRVNTLERERSERTGAMKGLGFLKDYGGWIVTALIGLSLYVENRLKHG